MNGAVPQSAQSASSFIDAGTGSGSVTRNPDARSIVRIGIRSSANRSITASHVLVNAASTGFGSRGGAGGGARSGPGCAHASERPTSGTNAHLLSGTLIVFDPRVVDGFRPRVEACLSPFLSREPSIH